MNIKDFNEAIYASSNGVVVEHRKSIIAPVVVILVGIALFVANSLIANTAETTDLKSTLILAGAFVVGAGVIFLCIRIFGAGIPYHTADKCYLVAKQYSFSREQQGAVVKAIEACDRLALDALEESDIAGITVICYHSPRSKYCAMQAFAYDEFVYKGITELKIRN